MNPSPFRFWLSTSLHLAAVALGARAITSSAHAQQVYYVNRSTDNGDFQTGEGTSVGGFSGDLRYCLIQSQRYQNPQARTSTTIVIQTTPTLSRPLPPWTPNAAQDLTIQGDGQVRTISGANAARLFFFEAPGSTMTLRDLVLTNGRGKGGDGLDGGGGGAGLGGAVYVGAGVLYSYNVSFTSNAAIGGTAQPGGGGGGGGIGASGGAHSGSGGGGGGGFFGGGGWGGGDCGGGGGGLAWAGNNAANHYGGGGGGLTQAGQPDTRSPGANGGTGGDNAELGGDHYEFVNGLAAPLPGGGGGGGGNGGNGGYSGGNGGAGNKYGGGGGAGPRGSVSGTTRGGNGGEYGGGGGTMADNGGGGGNGGFGGGGGSGPLGGGSGGFGAGRGAKTGSGPVASTAGSGLGGAVFVRSGAGYVFNGGSFAGNTVTAGGGGGGSAQGSGIYVMSGSTFLCNLSAGNFQTIANDIAGDGNLDMQGPGAGILSLSGTNTHTGYTIIENGAVQVQSSASLSPNSILNIWDYGTLDLYGNSLIMTPGQLGGSTGTVLNNKPNAPLTLTLNAPADNTRDVSVAITDGISPITLLKTGPAPFRFSNFNRVTGGLTVNTGTVSLAAGGGFGSMTGPLTITPGTTVNATATNALGFVGGRKVDSVTINAGTLLHSAANDQGWGVAYTLNNGAIMDFGGGSDSTSAWAFGGPGPGVAPNANTSVNATGAAPSEIRGRITLRPDNGNTACSFTVANGSTLKVPAAIGNPAASTTWPTLYKEGQGLMTLSNTNTYLGNTIVNGGTLELGGYRPGGFGTIVGGITINTGASVKATVTDALGYAPGSKLGGIVINNTGKLLHASPGNQGWGIGYTLNNGGTMDFTTGSDATSAWAFGGPATNPTSVLAVGAAASQIKGRIDLRGDAGATVVDFNVAGDANTTSTLNVPATIFCSTPTVPPTLTKSGNGILVLSGTNSYPGVTNLAGGTLAVTNASALGSGGKIQFTGGTLRFDYAQPQDPSARFLAPAAGNSVRIDTNGNAATLASPIPGSGGLVKLGTSTLTLTGAQTYTGNTTISGGTLRLGDGTTSGTIAGNVANSGTLEFASPGTQSFGGLISGTGGVTKSGAGTLTLTGAQTYTGNTTISGGTLRLGNGTTAGSITGDVANSGTLEFAAPAAQAFGGIISGTGGVTKSGTGILTLTGAQTYTGNTSVSAGTLRLGDGTSPGSIAGNVANSGTLEFAAPGAQSFGGIISGAGGVTKTGTGTLTLTGAQSYTGTTTISSGTLRLGNGTIAGSIAGNVANDGTLEFAAPGAQSFGGAISGAGGVTKSGTGALTFTVAQTYSGPTVVSSGSLTLASTASLSAGEVTVASGAELNGGGTINGTVSVSGDLASTDSTLNGGLTVNGGGLASASSGTFTVNGAILNNGTIRITGGAKLLAGGATSFVNNGVLDLITADPGYTLPENFTNGPNGIVLTRDSLHIKELMVAADGTTVTLSIDGYTSHNYTLQRSATLADADFHTLVDVAPQSGTTGSVLFFTDSTPSASEPFYRLVVAP